MEDIDSYKAKLLETQGLLAETILELEEKTSASEPIAVIGLGMRLPGEINNQNDFWKTIINKIDAVDEIPSNRFPNLNNYINNNRASGKIVTKKGGYLKDIEYFDANFFQISPKEAEKLDPQQRLLLETSFEAIEDAGIPLEKLSGSKTGVFIGCWINDFEHKLAKTKHDIDVYSTTGSGRYPLSGRLSFFYNLQGPSITIDTACSSSLVALHLAIQSLKNGESDIAFAGAANTILDPFISIGYSRSNLLSDYGSCHFGSKDVGGYVRSEGAATVILKRLKDAVKDGDQIYAILPGSAVNNDGQSDKYMLAPSAVTQEIMIRTAHKNAHIDSKDVQYIEAHGTGTKAGDPAEINSIWKAISDNRTVNDKVFIGSVKTNIGHTESVAGFAGLFKTILAIKHKTIPPNLHFYEPSPEIDWKNIGVEIPTTEIPFNKNKPIIAGVNAFGITGTNAHVVVQEFTNIQNISKQKNKSQFVFPLSSANEKATQIYAEKHMEYLAQQPETDVLEYTRNVQSHKANLLHRNAIIFNDKQTLIDSLSAIKNNQLQENIISGYADNSKPKIVFVFPGQGSQWLQMGKQLYESEPVFKKIIDECEVAFYKYTNWKLTEQLFSNNENALSEIDIIQPALVAVEIALAKLWINIGVIPDAVIGHSMGEVAAAYISNAISLDEAANIICTRSKLMKTVSGKGAMGYIALSEEETLNEIKDYQDKVVVGVNNSPKSTVISGDKSEVVKVLQILEDKGIFSRAIKVDVASHSTHMDVLKQDLQNEISVIQPVDTVIKFYSTVEGEEVHGSVLNADYWVKNLRQPVQFGKTIQALLNQEHTIFIECSPHAVLTQAMQENIDFLGKDATVIASLERDKDEELSLIKNISTAYCHGVLVNWKSNFGNYKEKILLPSYPWQRTYHWLNDTVNNDQLISSNNSQPTRSFLNSFLKLNTALPIFLWQSSISLFDYPYLEHHKVSNQIVFPAAAFFEMINEASKQLFPHEKIIIENISINNALVLEEGKNYTIQILIQKEIGNEYLFKIDGINIDNELTNHCKGTIQLKNSISYQKINSEKLDTLISKQMHYEATSAMNLQYDASFQLIDNITSNGIIFKTRISSDKQTNQEYEEYNFHPALLDACFQTFLAAIYSQEKDALFVPASCKQFQFVNSLKAPSEIETIVQITFNNTNQIKGDIQIFDEQKNLLAIGKDFVFERVDKKPKINLQDVYYHSNWEKLVLNKEVNISDNILIIHNNASAELLHQYFVQHKAHCDFIDIASFSVNDFQLAISNYKDSKNQLFFILDKQNESQSIEEIQDKQEQHVLAVVNLIQAVNQTQFSFSPRLWIITQQGQQVIELENVIAEQHQVSAFCRVAWNEHFELKPSTIDIVNDDALKIIPSIIAQNNNENEIAVRNNEIYTARLEHINIQKEKNHFIKAEHHAFTAAVEETGIIENLMLKQINIPKISEDEVLIEVKAVGVNFMNLMSVLGIYPGKENGFATLGIECSGIVKETGVNITHLKIGDKVMGMAYHSLASHVVVNGGAMRKIPDHLSYTEAATIPAVFLTAFYGLVELAKIKAGDKVLIHAATGGVGLAAIQIARYFGAEVYATAGSQDKRNYLKSLGIQYVYDSRTIDFYEQILTDTSHNGIDIVLNSLTGDAMYKSMQLLKSFGRFVEIGKKDIFENSKLGLQVFQNSLSYHMVDMEKMLFEKPEFLGEILQEIIILINERELQPLEKNIFPLQQIKEAFGFMNASKHIGKVVIDLEHQHDIEIQALPLQFNKEATYLLTGGTGGLGLVFTEWMFNNNASNFILIARNKPSAEAQIKIDTLIAQGANINCVSCNISNKEELKSVIENINESLPLKGVFHLAGILEDASIQNINQITYHKVLIPKIGAFNLHELTANLKLDHFVLFSSSAVLFASVGQAAYVSANAYMDALAINRHLQNLPALSIQWGTVTDVGLAASTDNRGNRLLEEGITPLQPQDCTNIFTAICHHNNAVIGAFYFDVDKWKNHYTSAKLNPYFDKLSDAIPYASTNVKASFLEELKKLNSEYEIHTIIEEKLKEVISKVTKVNILNIDTESTFKSLGIDSLMSVQLKNKLEKVFTIPLSVTAFWTYPSIKKYAKFLTEKLSLFDRNDTEIKNIERKEISEVKPADHFNIDAVSDDDISRLLEEEMKNL